MIKQLIMILGLMLVSNFVSLGYAAEQDINLNQEIALIRYQVTAIEHDFANNQTKEKIIKLEELSKKTDQLIAQFPNKPDPYVWEGVVFSRLGKYKQMAAIGTVKKAKVLLEKAAAMDPAACDGQAYNTLAILYSRVPPWPILFGNDKKADEYFKKALAASSNLDTNYGYGEFLISKGKIAQGLEYLNKALAFFNRPDRPEDELKKKEIAALIQINMKKK